MGLEKFIQAKKCFKKIANLYKHSGTYGFKNVKFLVNVSNATSAKTIFYHNIFKLHEKIK